MEKPKLDCLNTSTVDETDVCIVYLYTKNTGYDSDFKESFVFKLKDYLTHPELLAMELAYHLNACIPLGPTATEKIKEIDAKLFDLEKKRELLKQEEENLKLIKKQTEIATSKPKNKS